MPPVGFTGALSFNFTLRGSTFDWRQLHGTDLQEVAATSDVAAIEALLPMLQHGSLDREPAVSSSNCLQLVGALQLAAQYLQHLQEAHLRLISCHQEATQAAQSWKAAADQYIAAVHDAQAQLAQPQAEEPASESSAAELLRLRDALELCDGRYNEALDALEAEDARCRHVRFMRRRAGLDWRLLHSVDMRQLESAADAEALQPLVEQVAWGDLAAERAQGAAAANLRQLVAVGQGVLDLLRVGAAGSGALLAEEMQVLHAESAAIPALTTAVQEGHVVMDAIVRDMARARHERRRQERLPPPASPPPRPASAPPGMPCIGVPVQLPAWPAQPMQLPAAPALPAAMLAALLAAGVAGPPQGLRLKLDSLEGDLRTECQRTADMRHALRRIEEALRRPSPPAPAPAPVLPAPQIQIVHVPVPMAMPSPPPPAAAPVVYSRQGSAGSSMLRRSSSVSPTRSSAISRRETCESMSGGTGRRTWVFLDEEGLRGEEREHSVAQLEHQVLHLKRKVLEDALARRTSRSPSQASGRGGGAGGLGTTSMLSDFGM